MNVVLNSWQVQKEAARYIREQVFVIEHQIPPELELDKMDEHAIHALAIDEAGMPIGTGRLLPDGHIGRVAVLPAARGLGIGTQIMLGLVQAAKERGDKHVVLSAMSHKKDFYLRLGFQVKGEEYMEAGIKHIEMEMTL
jgi:predicted GNAT family N-acyltransferase